MDPDAITYLKFMKRFAKGFYRFHVQVICRFIKNEEVRTVKKKKKLQKTLTRLRFLDLRETLIFESM